MTVTKPLTLLIVHAHPDDEIFFTGGIFSRAHEQGIHTVLVTATGGENGEMHDPAFDPVADLPRLAEIRAAELARSAEILGIDEVRFLGYRDSGMLGTPENTDPRAFLNANRDEAIGRLVAILREVRPDVALTYDAGGGYGHPDHTTAHTIATAAVEASGDPNRFPEAGPPWTIPKFYWFANVRENFARLGQELVSRGIRSPLEDAGYDVMQFLVPESEITAKMDVREYVPRKLEALKAHRSQMADGDFFGSLPEDLRLAILGQENFIRVHSHVPAPDMETDIFTGLR